MDGIIAPAIGLLIAAIVVAQVARRLALPYTVGLVIAGAVLALLHVHFGIALTHDLIFDVILPPLLFEAAINIHWPELRRDLWPVLVLAIPGTVIAAAIVTVGLVFVMGWPLPPALVFGVLIAATDPVAVIALFKDNRIEGRLRLLVESESLFNDGVAAVLFALASAWVAGQVGTSDGGGMAISLLVIAGGGLAVGCAVGAIATILAGRVADPLVEGALTWVTAYGSFLLAEHFHLSGVLATVVAGLIVGNLHRRPSRQPQQEDRRREFVLALWEFIAFIANSVIFLLIGVATAQVAFKDLGVVALAGIIVLVLVSRAATVYPLCLIFRGSTRAIPLGEQHVLWWGGLRGALGLALALALPDTMPMRDDILIAAFAVVAFSVVVQGITMPLLLRRLGFAAKRGAA
ncbi:MAG TPA: sodium:proton antiporter [Magnetospirillaceae bacterium]|jgi:CPA1 family monovalent cation:H+ antiporter